MSRVPRWRSEGHEPDYRFSLANERTFLAWVRTSIALVAGSIAIDQFANSIHHRWVRTSLSIGLALAGLTFASFAYWRWRGNEIAMRHDRPLPHTPILLVVTVVVGVIAAVILVVIVGQV